MKYLILILTIICAVNYANSQTLDTINHTNMSHTRTNLYKFNHNQIIQSMGKYYNCDQLMKMPIRNINKIAATVAGVDSRNGETPIIRGAVGGTAYFIDGVRVYNMPSLFLIP
jgi:hypothetical protein